MKNFKTWSQESLADFASDAFKRIKEQDDAIEQLRKDLSDAMKLLRELNRQKNEFVFCAECGADGGHALYCVACAEKFVKREWVGLTKEDMPDGENPMFDHKYFIAGMVYANNTLLEKNT